MSRALHVARQVASGTAVLAMLLAPIPTAAAVFNVSNANELRQALSDAEQNGEDNIINLAAGHYDVSGGLRYQAGIHALTVQGAGIGRGGTILDGGNVNRPLYVIRSGAAIDDVNATVTIRGMTFFRGLGSGLQVGTNRAHILVEDCLFLDNVSDSGGGAALASEEGDIIMRRNTFRGNRVENGDGGGVGVYLTQGTVTITGNTFVDNSSGSFGGGASTSLVRTAVITNNTFAGNTATGVVLDEGIPAHRARAAA